ncbi:MAG: glycoside hydrolase family 5 protein, partial [Bacteroidales bacterium]
MKRNLIYCLVLLVSISSCTKPSPEEFTLKHGTNISHWLSQSDRRGEERLNFFTEKDMDLIAEVGYDHIRLPIDEEQLWDESGAKIEEAFTLLHNAIEWAMERDLKVVVDLHIIRSHHFNEGDRPLWTDPAEQDKFIDLWRDLSSELKQYPVSDVAYELMNEAVTDDPDNWNNLIART